MKWVRAIYPILIALILAFLLVLASRKDLPANAGSIRIAILSPDRPLTVRLAQGHTTAISFAVRPEKVVPGNPQALEINFLSRDLTIRPLAPHPGNLIVYTKSNRYVILLQIGTDANYDDVVSVRASGVHSRIIRLGYDSFRVDDFLLKIGKQESHISGEIQESEKYGSFQDLPKGLHCPGCVVKDGDTITDIACRSEISKLECKIGKQAITLLRTAP